MNDVPPPPAHPEPPFANLPARFRDTPYDELPPALQRRAQAAVEQQPPSGSEQEAS